MTVALTQTAVAVRRAVVAMESRDELMRVLLDGLPPDEQIHALQSISDVGVQKAQQIQAANARETRRKEIRAQRRASIAQEEPVES